MQNSKLKLGVSACLLGQPVRYDGGHKLDHFLTDILGRFVEFVPVCPEVECGLSTPRESMRLVGDSENPRLLAPRSGMDHTERMGQWAARRLPELEAVGLSGFVFKSNSPSSGMERVKVYNESGMAMKNGTGLFAKAFMQHFPNLPVEEEGRLHDADLRHNFIVRLFVCHRWQNLMKNHPLPAALMEFHANHKLLLMAHDPKAATWLGRLAGESRATSFQRQAAEYNEHLMVAMRKKATPAKNTNVLMHVMGYFKKQLTADEKQEMLEVIEQYRNGHVPLIVSITLLNHYVRKYGVEYLQHQHYLNPGPVELHLLNHV